MLQNIFIFLNRYKEKMILILIIILPILKVSLIEGIILNLLNCNHYY